jgi:hypothetical protein
MTGAIVVATKIGPGAVLSIGKDHAEAVLPGDGRPRGSARHVRPGSALRCKTMAGAGDSSRRDSGSLRRFFVGESPERNINPKQFMMSLNDLFDTATNVAH